MTICGISVVIPTHQRTDSLLLTLERIRQCEPQPQEVIIHIDYGDNVTKKTLENIKNKYSYLQIIQSDHRVGPGGGRNRAIALARNELVASFDDDSYPIDKDYFLRLQHLFNAFPRAAVFAASIYHINEQITPDELTAKWASSFVGCGCAYRKDVFQQTHGYVPLPLAYGMEEVDLSLRLHNMGWGILETPWLRVFHNTKLEHHNKPKITAASISNLILLAYLRYPPYFWWLGIAQAINRIIWLIRYGRTAGIVAGIFAIPKLIHLHHQQRRVVPAKSLLSYFQLRKKTVNASFDIKLNLKVNEV